ncbi:unnamed protein product [Lactuca saligna]|uniref:Secreted protein n=1 Tax=Lactuca saligna TaxID=75948 RepID=A0AA35YF02_LACSI|nr:unnamed protein product [Lactuca saligna]
MLMLLLKLHLIGCCLCVGEQEGESKRGVVHQGEEMLEKGGMTVLKAYQFHYHEETSFVTLEQHVLAYPPRRDVGLNQIALFEGKVVGGNGVLSKDVYKKNQEHDLHCLKSKNQGFESFLICFEITINFFTNKERNLSKIEIDRAWLLWRCLGREAMAPSPPSQLR